MGWFAHFGFGKKLGIAFGVLLLLSVLLGITGWWSIERVVPFVEGMYEDEVLPTTYLATIEATWYEIRLNEYKHYFGENEKVYNDARQRVQTNLGIIDSVTQLYRATQKSDEELRLLSEYLRAVENYNATREPFFQLSEKATKKEAYAYLMGPSKDARSSVMRTMNALIKQQAKSAHSKYAVAQKLAKQIKTWQLGLTIIVVALGIIFAFLIARSITRRLTTLAQKADTIARGDLTQSVHDTSGDEIGLFTQRFEMMVENLRTILSHLSDTVAAVTSASAQILASTEEMAAGAIEQSSQTNDITNSVEELVAATQKNAEMANTTAHSAQDALTAAERGTVTVENTIERMNRIATVVKTSAQKVEELGKAGDEIGEIVDLINDIADQTNLLALNAAIEAARAGEEGRGFAVVADEVRRLAERTAKATKDISEMIRKIQTETKEAVVSMTKGTQEVTEGIQLADSARNALKEIQNIARQVFVLNNQIAEALKAHNDIGISIKQNIERVAAVTNETANGTQQIATAAENLNRLIENLQSLLNQFQIVKKERYQTKQRERLAQLPEKAIHSVG